MRKMRNPASLQQPKGHFKEDTGHKILYDVSVNSSFQQAAANNNDRLQNESAHVCQTPTKLYQAQPWKQKVSINLHDEAQSERKQQSPLAQVPA